MSSCFKSVASYTLYAIKLPKAIGCSNNLILIHNLIVSPGMESMEFLPEQNAIKLFGDADLEHVYKRDGLLESFRDVPMSIESENGSVLLNLQTRLLIFDNNDNFLL